MSARLRFLVAIAAALSVAAIAVNIWVRMPERHPPATARKPVHKPVRPPPSPAPEKPTTLDRALLVSSKAFARCLSAADSPTYPPIVPLTVCYWDAKAPIVYLESDGARSLPGAPSGVFWYAWDSEGKRIICATRRRIFAVEVSSGESKSIFCAYRIECVHISPDRTKLAVTIGMDLFVLEIEGNPLGHSVFDSPLLDAAWNPDSTRLACSTRNVVWTVEPGARPRLLARHWTMRGYEYPNVRHRVQRIDSLSWSPSGRHVAYRTHTLETDPPRPDLVVANASTGKHEIVMEAYYENDGHYCWSPVDEWMVVTDSGGDVDQNVDLARTWGDYSMQMGCVGPGGDCGVSCWRPGSAAFASYYRIHDPSWWPPEAQYSVGVSKLYPQFPPPLYWNPKHEKLNLYALARRFAAGKVVTSDYTIPDFDWSPDGSRYAFVDRFYSMRQLGRRKGDSFPGKPLAVLRIQAGDGDQHIVAACGEFPAMPRFSPDGGSLAYLSGGFLRILPLEAERRSESAAGRWLAEAQRKMKLGDHAGAVTALRNSVRHSPNSARAHLTLARVYVELAKSECNPYRKQELLRGALLEAECAGHSRMAQYLDEHLREIFSIAAAAEEGSSLPAAPDDGSWQGALQRPRTAVKE